MYDNRSSKEEDVELIHRLQAESDSKSQLLKKAEEDMKFYKLELINREQNYNNVFGSKPVIGTLNPLDLKSVFLYREFQIQYQ